MRQFENTILFYLVDPVSGDYYYIDNTGAVALTSTPTFLQDEDGDPEAPEGWSNTEITWVRSKIYWGLTRTFTQDYNFHGNTAKILRSIYFAGGSTASCRVIIKKYDYQTSVTLNTYYQGDLDFQRATPNRHGFRIPVKEMGLRDLFTQNEKVTYTIPIDGSDVIDAGLYGYTLEGTMNWMGDNSTSYPLVGNTVSVANILPLAFTVQDGDFEIGVDQVVHPGLSGNLNPSNWFFRSNRTQQVTITVTGLIDMDFVNTGLFFTNVLAAAVEVHADTSGSSLITSVPLFNIGGLPLALAGPQPTVPINVTQTFTVNEGNAFYAFIFHDTASLDVSSFVATDLKVTITSDFSNPFSSVKTFQEYIVFEKTVEAMTGGAYTADSTFLQSTTDFVDSRPAQTLYTTGDAIRKISDSTGVPDNFKITPADVFKNVMVDYGAAITIENDQVCIKPKSEVLDKTNEILELTNCRDLEVMFDEELLNNVIEAGNIEQDYDFLNGKDEFMNVSKWKTALLNPQVLDLIRPFRYDATGIEFVRNKLFQKNTTDNEADNQVFVWEADFSTIINGCVAIRREQNAGGGNFATGTLFPDTRFNISKSPARVLQRNADFVQGMLAFEPSSNITFQSTEKNDKLVSDLGFGTITENASIVANTLGGADPLFLPLIFKFKAIEPDNLLQILDSDPNGYFKFTYNGVELKGFPMKVAHKPVLNDQFEIELLCHPDVTPADIQEALGG